MREVRKTRPKPFAAELGGRYAYLKRIADVYARRDRGPLAFWYETPEVNDRSFGGETDEYYMTFAGKAAYSGPFDVRGIPLLDYRGDIGLQYNPIAIAQYGLALFNRFRTIGDRVARDRFLATADWLVEHLEPNPAGLKAWHHHFMWRYREPLIAPWFSGLAQGQGLSVLVRAFRITSARSYNDAAVDAFQLFLREDHQGGVVNIDEQGFTWIEEYLVRPASHILNGFLWGLWGVYDYARFSARPSAWSVFDSSVRTLRLNLHRFDTGFWSLYELRSQGPRMLASPYYHRLHIVQLRVLARLTGDDFFADMATRWENYSRSRANRIRALTEKVAFKLLYY